MPDEHNAFDLGALANPLTDTSKWTIKGDAPVDLSGKPKPTNVRVQLNSGVIIRCDCRYQGINLKDGDRLFTVIAEIDWENYHPRLLLVEDMPNDVEFRFRIPGMPDAAANAVFGTLQLIPERIINVR